LSRVELGEEIIISNQGIPIAKLVPFRTSSNRRASLGKDRGQFVLPEDFNAPLPTDIEAAFSGMNSETIAGYPVLVGGVVK